MIAITQRVQIINLTSNDVVIMNRDSRQIIKTYPRARAVAKVVCLYPLVKNLEGEGGVPIVQPIFSEMVNLPERKAGVFYIVTMFIKHRLRDRPDLLVPAGTIRDTMGKVIGCTALSI